MQQGDQYSIRLDIQQDGEPLAPADVTGVKVVIAGIEQRYPDGGLTYDTVIESWLFPITQEQTLALRGMVPAQVQVNFGGNPAQIIGSKVYNVNVSESIIRTAWDG